MERVIAKKFIAIFLVLIFALNSSAFSFVQISAQTKEKSLENLFGEAITICSNSGSQSISAQDYVLHLELFKDNLQQLKQIFKSSTDSGLASSHNFQQFSAQQAVAQFKIDAKQSFSASIPQSHNSQAPPYSA